MNVLVTVQHGFNFDFLLTTSCPNHISVKGELFPIQSEKLLKQQFARISALTYVTLRLFFFKNESETAVCLNWPIPSGKTSSMCFCAFT